MIQVRKAHHVPILSHQTLPLSQRLTLPLPDLEYPRSTPCDKRVCKTARLPTTASMASARRTPTRHLGIYPTYPWIVINSLGPSAAKPTHRFVGRCGIMPMRNRAAIVAVWWYEPDIREMLRATNHAATIPRTLHNYWYATHKPNYFLNRPPRSLFGPIRMLSVRLASG